jgi:hypothetical protein
MARLMVTLHMVEEGPATWITEVSLEGEEIRGSMAG